MKSVRRSVCIFMSLLLLLCSSSYAVSYVTFSDIPGDWNNYSSPVVWMNAEYVPSSANVFIDTELMEGGEVAPGVFEYMADATDAYSNPGSVLAYLYIDAPGEILYVSAFEGNWATKEYMLLNSVATDGMYVELCLPSFNDAGEILNTDRIYLIEYEVDGVWYYECVTFYFRYFLEETRSFLPQKTAVPADDEAVNDETPVIAPETEEPSQEEIVQDEPAKEEPVQEEIPAEEPQPQNEEEASIGIIGGADGPTSVIVAAPEGTNAFGQFFFNFAGGLAAGMNEMGQQMTEEAADEAEVSEVTETTEESTDSEETVPEITEEATEEVTEVVTEEAAAEDDYAEAANQEGSAFGQFFFGVFGQ